MVSRNDGITQMASSRDLLKEGRGDPKEMRYVKMTEQENKAGWWSRLKQGLKKSSDRLTDGLKTIFIHRRLDKQMLQALEELLITSDLGVKTSALLTQELASQKMDKEVTLEEVREILAQSIEKIIEPLAIPLAIDPARKPHVILMVGVNGTGKTTTIGKLARLWQTQNLSVQLVAGDTFRAAAVEQLQVWGQRLQVPVTIGTPGCDAAALVFDAFTTARQNNTDVLMIDTAGRLHNKEDLMQELKKIIRVIKKVDESAPHSVVLVLDATTGQNAHHQVKVFQEIAGVSGLIMTKLDGTARGGVVVSLAEEFGLPIHALGVGESLDDLKPFTASEFARNLVGTPS